LRDLIGQSSNVFFVFLDHPAEVGGDFGPYYQSRRQDIYRNVAQKLLDENKAYCCYCLPEELEEDRKRALAEGGAGGILRAGDKTG